MGSGNLLLTILFSLALGIGAGIIGATYRHILAYEPILNWWFRFGAKYEGRWFYKLVWACEKCFSGQVALWTYLLLRILPACVKHYRQFLTIGGWSVETVAALGTGLFGLILAICCAVLFGKIFGHIIINFEK